MSKKEKLNYYELKNIFKKSHTTKVYKEANLTSYLLFILGVYIASFISIFFMKEKYIIYMLIIIGILIFIIFKIVFSKTKEFFLKKFSKHKNMIQKSSNLLIYRYILFDKECKGYNYNSKKIINKINAELNIKNTNILKDPFLASLITLGVSFIVLWIDKLFTLKFNSDLDLFYIVFFLYGILLLLYIAGSSTTQTEEKKLKEFKYFIELRK